jgi:hypothetical protein
MTDEARPYPKAQQLARGARRYRRKVASPKQWQAIIAAKQGPCRVSPRFFLAVPCVACNREPGVLACNTCSALEAAELRAGSAPSPQLRSEPVQYHHLIPRAQGGDDTADNIVPLSPEGHALVTLREPGALRRLAESLTDAEYAYVIDKLGEGALERLFGVMRR